MKSKAQRGGCLRPETLHSEAKPARPTIRYTPSKTINNLGGMCYYCAPNMQKFSELNLSEKILKAITDLGYENTTPIQAETLPILLEGDTDFLGLAATGTGKTAAFGIPLLERIDPKQKGVQALILCPTRELAIQVAGQIDLLGKYLGIKALPIYGGAGYGDQIYGLKNGATIVVGTPGRVVDHMEKGTLKLDLLKTLVLDEADEMISMGFKDDLEFVLSKAPKGQANIWLFSATMGGEVRRVADAYLKNPKKVQVNRTEMLPDTVEQIYFMVHEYDKPDLVTKVIDAADEFYGIIFCQTKSLVIDLTQFLVSKGYKTDCLHGDMDQTGRDRVMRAFREKKISTLIATDVACRGLDVKDITHVINYSIPRELDNYVHRIGRTGRSGKSGIALSLVTNSHKGLIRRIEEMTKSRMKEGKLPTLKDVAVKKVAKSQVEFEKIGPQGRMTELLGEEWKTSLEPLSKEEIVGRFITLLHPELATGKAKPEMGDSRPVEATSERRSERRPESRSARPERSERRPSGSYEARSERRPEGRPERRPEPRREYRPAAAAESADAGSLPKPLARPAAARPALAARSERSDRPERAERPERSERRYQGKPGGYEPAKRDFKSDDKRTPPWERKDSGTKPAGFKSAGGRFAPKSTPWGARPAAESRVAPASRWKKKSEFSARDASEAKPKKWESRPTKPRS